MKRTVKRNPARAAEPSYTSLLRAGGLGCLLGVLLLFAIALLLSFVALKSGTPQTLIFPAALIAVFAGGYGGALLGAKKTASCGINPYFGGLTAGGMLLLFVLALSLFFPAAEGRTTIMRLAPMAVLLAAALLGSLTAAMHRPNSKRKLKKLTRAR